MDYNKEKKEIIDKIQNLSLQKIKIEQEILMLHGEYRLIEKLEKEQIKDN